MSNTTTELAEYWTKRTVDTQFILDSGLMFMANQHVFHPLGLALVARKREDGSLYLAIKDARSTPEVMLYNKEDAAKSKAKYENFMKAYGYEQVRIRDRNIKRGNKNNK